MTRCPKCRKGELRQQVNVIVDAPADVKGLNKDAIRSRRVKILGVDWGGAAWYCSAGCGYHLRLRPK